jgi:hypothetical protein
VAVVGDRLSWAELRPVACVVGSGPARKTEGRTCQGDVQRKDTKNRERMGSSSPRRRRKRPRTEAEPPNSGKQLLAEEVDLERGFRCGSEGLRGSPGGAFYRSRGGRFEEIRGENCGGH